MGGWHYDALAIRPQYLHCITIGIQWCKIGFFPLLRLSPSCISELVHLAKEHICPCISSCILQKMRCKVYKVFKVSMVFKSCTICILFMPLYHLPTAVHIMYAYMPLPQRSASCLCPYATSTPCCKSLVYRCTTLDPISGPF